MKLEDRVRDSEKHAKHTAITSHKQVVIFFYLDLSLCDFCCCYCFLISQVEIVVWRSHSDGMLITCQMLQQEFMPQTCVGT